MNKEDKRQMDAFNSMPLNERLEFMISVLEQDKDEEGMIMAECNIKNIICYKGWI